MKEVPPSSQPPQPQSRRPPSPTGPAGAFSVGTESSDSSSESDSGERGNVPQQEHEREDGELLTPELTADWGESENGKAAGEDKHDDEEQKGH